MDKQDVFRLFMIIIFIFIVTAIIYGVSSVSDSYDRIENENKSLYKEISNERAYLKKLNVETNTETHTYSRSGYFLFFGSSRTESHTEPVTKVRFCFLNSLNEYQFMDKEISQVLVCDQHDSIEPYVEFVDCHEKLRTAEDRRNVYYSYKFVKVHCNRGDFFDDVNMGELK